MLFSSKGSHNLHPFSLKWEEIVVDSGFKNLNCKTIRLAFDQMLRRQIDEGKKQKKVFCHLSSA